MTQLRNDATARWRDGAMMRRAASSIGVGVSLDAAADSPKARTGFARWPLMRCTSSPVTRCVVCAGALPNTVTSLIMRIQASSRSARAARPSSGWTLGPVPQAASVSIHTRLGKAANEPPGRRVNAGIDVSPMRHILTGRAYRGAATLSGTSRTRPAFTSNFTRKEVPSWRDDPAVVPEAGSSRAKARKVPRAAVSA